MGVPVPFVHAVKYGLGLMNRYHRRFGHGFELAVGNDDRDFDDPVAVGFKAGHFHVQPDKVVLILCHNRREQLKPHFVTTGFRNP